MLWSLIVDPIVAKQLKKIPREDAQRIFRVIEELPANPYAGDIEKMKGERDSWRRRVGVYRIFYDLSTREQTIHVYDVKRRTSKTY